MEASGFLIAEDDSVRLIFQHLDAAALDAARATCRSWHKLSSEPQLWRKLAASAFWADAPDAQPALPIAPVGGGLMSNADGGSYMPSSAVEHIADWRVAYYRWAALSRYVDGGCGTSARLWIQIAGAWATIEQFVREKIPEIEQTLCRPTTPDQLVKLRSRALRYTYAIHNGQDLGIDRFLLVHDDAGVRANMSSLWHGLFGGYKVYSSCVCMRMHPLSVGTGIASSLAAGFFRIANQGAGGGEHAMEDRREPLELLSTSSRSINRCFAVDSEDGIYYRSERGEWIQAAPTLGAWLSEYARRLSSSYYRVGEVDNACRAILLFPDQVDGLWCSRSVTQGIEVVASALCTPEHPQAFAYSLRLRMLADCPHTSAQLFQRRWTITDGQGPPRHVVGEGVVGKFPVLTHGGYRDDEQSGSLDGQPFANAVPAGPQRPGSFVYQSFSGPMDAAEGGRFGGEILFVPGTVSTPTGEPFVVTVAPFALARPEFIY
jgi:uncharacterized protein affecting Mg2+/Co2+ transport